MKPQVRNNNNVALCVLMAFEKDIRAFLQSLDQPNLSRATWWLSHSTVKTSFLELASWPTNAQFLVLTRHLYTRLTRGDIKRDKHQKKRMKIQLRIGQVRQLVQNLVPVALGLRPSCLVDCCALTKELAELLLESFDNEDNSIQQWFNPKQVRCVLLEENVFFVNVKAFVHEKMVELATGWNGPMYVDVSASLSLPRLICSSSVAGGARLQALADWITSACKNLLSSTSSRVLEWERPLTLHATAVAGIMLCYPCVYDILEDRSDVTKTDDWNEQENCLAMCRLWLFQIKALVPSKHVEMKLQEFSVPQHLLAHRTVANMENEADSPLVKLLRARCRLKLQHAIERSSWVLNGVRPQVHVSSRMLHCVAL